MALIPYESPTLLYDDPAILYEQPVPESPQGIEAWVTTPAGVYIAHLDRSVESPFRNFAFHRERNAAGGGSLEYHLDNAIVREHPTIFAKGNLVHMRYREREQIWVVRGNGSELGQTEHAGDWVKVNGPGFWPRRRLVLPTPFDDGANLDPSTWPTQWRSFVNRAAGELLWDLIVDMNARFATQIIRGTVETTGADGLTVDYAWEDLGDDVIPAVLAARGGEVRFDGLTFNYYNPGHGTDRSETVIFEEGADLVSLKYTSTRRDDSLTWVVGQGVGEGVFAKLAVSEIPDADRREGFFAAKEAGNVPLLELLTEAALAEHRSDEEALAVEVTESRFRALVDYDLSDTVRVVSSSRGVDRVAQIVASYVREDGDRVRTAFDLGAVREDPDLAHDRELKTTRSQIGVRNRQPQGQLVPFGFNGNGVLDSNEPAIIDFLISDRIYVTIETLVLFAFSEFWAPATAATSGGGSTSGSSSASSTASGGSSSPTTAGGGAATLSEDENIQHNHDILTTIAGHLHNLGDNANFTVSAGIPHTHDVLEHTHDVTIGGHTHDIPHTHGVDPHAHGLTYGIFKETMPGSHSVNVGVYKRGGSSWDLVVTLSGLTDDLEELDLTQYIDGPGSWRLAIQSAAAQPQGGRLTVSVSGFVLGAIRSA